MMPGASATMRLGLALPDSYVDPDRAAWEAHHARHDPEMLDEDDAARRKSELVEAIETKKSRGEDASEPFGELQGLLQETRAEHESDLESLRARADRAKRFRAMHEVATDRTWAYPLFPTDRLIALRDGIRAQFGS